MYTQASDIYSLSLVLWEIISGKIPYLDPPLPPNSLHSYLNFNVPPSPLQPPPPQNTFSATLSTLTKNFSFQSLTGLSTHDTIQHSHSLQSYDPKKSNYNSANSNNNHHNSIRNLILSGYRPEIPLCPHEYADIIRSGWNSDRYIRPRATGWLFFSL